MIGRRVVYALFAAVVFVVQSYVAFGEDTVEVDLKTLTSHPESYRGKIVRTCGWARNGFDGSAMTVARDLKGYGTPTWPPPGVGVHWLKDVSQTEHGTPEWLCISGRFDAMCGAPPGEVRCVSTGHPYQWVIDQQHTVRDD